MARQVAVKALEDLQQYRLHIQGHRNYQGAKNNYELSINNRSKWGLTMDLNNASFYTLSIIREAWELLAEAQSALAHTCVVLFNIRSSKLQFVFDCLKVTTQQLQSELEETWIHIANFPVEQAKTSIYLLRTQLEQFMVDVAGEIIQSKEKKSVASTLEQESDRNSHLESNASEVVVFGNAFGTSLKVYAFNMMT